MSSDQKIYDAIIHAARKSVEVHFSGNQKCEVTYGHLPSMVVAELKKAGLVIVSESEMNGPPKSKLPETIY